MSREADGTRDRRVLQFEELEFALQDDSLWRGGQSLKLTAKATAVLRHLITNPNLVLSKSELFGRV